MYTNVITNGMMACPAHDGTMLYLKSQAEMKVNAYIQIAVDTSWSMSNVIDSVRNTLIDFVRKCDMPLTVVTYDDIARTIFETNEWNDEVRANAVDTIKEQVKTRGQTNVYDALDLLNRSLLADTKTIRIVIMDGESNCGAVQDPVVLANMCTVHTEVVMIGDNCDLRFARSIKDLLASNRCHDANTDEDCTTILTRILASNPNDRVVWTLKDPKDEVLYQMQKSQMDAGLWIFLKEFDAQHADQLKLTNDEGASHPIVESIIVQEIADPSEYLVVLWKIARQMHNTNRMTNQLKACDTKSVTQYATEYSEMDKHACDIKEHVKKLENKMGDMIMYDDAEFVVVDEASPESTILYRSLTTMDSRMQKIKTIIHFFDENGEPRAKKMRKSTQIHSDAGNDKQPVFRSLSAAPQDDEAFVPNHRTLSASIRYDPFATDAELTKKILALDAF